MLIRSYNKSGNSFTIGELNDVTVKLPYQAMNIMFTHTVSKKCRSKKEQSTLTVYQGPPQWMAEFNHS